MEKILKFENWEEFCEILVVGCWRNQVTGNLNLGNDIVELIEREGESK